MGAISIFIPILVSLIAVLIAIFALPFFMLWIIPILSIVGVTWLIYYVDYTISSLIDKITSGDPGTIIFILIVVTVLFLIVRNKKKVRKWVNKK